MAGFFDSLLGLESDPQDRDYRLASEITDPDELEAYRAGASATGIPGLDYARSVARGVGREISEPSMGPLGERYQQTMDEHRARMAAANQLQKRYPQAFRSGRLGTVGNMPGAESVFLAQPGIAGMAGAAGMAGRAGARAGMPPRLGPGAPRLGLPAPSNIIEGEFSEAPPIASIGHNRPPIEPSNAQRPMSRFEANQGYMTTRVPGDDIYASSVGRVPRTTMGSFRDSPVKPSAGVNDEMYPSVGPQRTPFNPDYNPNKFNQNMFDAWRNAQIRRRGQRIDPAERFGGFDTDLTAINPRQAARAADEAYDTPRSTDLTTFRSRMPRSTMIEGEFTEVPGGGGGMPPRGPAGNFGAPQPGFPGSRLPLFARDAAGLAAGVGLYGAGKSAYDRAMEVLNQPRVVSRDDVPLPPRRPDDLTPGRTVQLPPIDIGGRRAATVAPGAANEGSARPVAAKKKARQVRRTEQPVDNRRYWGDWRDTEPFASDPLGNFIDELRGSTKQSRTPGTLQSYAEGGSIFDDIGSAFTSGISGLRSSRSRSSPLSEGLITAGLGMMASPQRSLWRAIGEGGLAGVKAYNTAQQRADADLSAENEKEANRKFEEDLLKGYPSVPKPPKPPVPVPELRRGGVARRGYALGGGQSEDFDPFGDVGEAIGSGLQSIGDTIGSAIMPAAQAAEDAAPRSRRGSSPLSDGLITAGLGMMASPSHSLARAVGEGGLRGMQAYQTAREQRAKEDQESEQRASDYNFSRDLTKAPRKVAEVPELPSNEPAKIATPTPEKETKTPDRVVATDRKETEEDPVMASMRRIEWLNSHVPQNATQERILTRAINEEKFKIQMLQKTQPDQQDGVIGILGQDQFGRPRRGWIKGPKAGQYLEEGTPGGSPAAGKNVHGDEFLTTLDPDMANTVKAITEGRDRMPTGPRAATVRAAVYQYDPNFRSGRYDIQQSIAKPSGYNFGATIGSGNMAIKHLGEISDAIEDLKKAEIAGGKFRPLNWAQQAVKSNLPGGFPEAERFKVAADRFAEEATKFYRGSGGNQADIQRAIERMNAARNPQELHDILEEETRLFSGKVKGLGSIYNQSFSSPYVQTPEFKPLDDTSDEIIDVIRGRASKKYTSKVHDISQSGSAKPKVKALNPGDRDGDYVFKGGDPADENNWEKQ